MVEIDIPRPLVWDYRQPPEDLLWRLQRIAEWFPAFGRDRKTVRALFTHRHELRVPSEVRELIEMYEEAWAEREEASMGMGDLSPAQAQFLDRLDASELARRDTMVVAPPVRP